MILQLVQPRGGVLEVRSSQAQRFRLLLDEVGRLGLHIRKCLFRGRFLVQEPNDLSQGLLQSLPLLIEPFHLCLLIDLRRIGQLAVQFRLLNDARQLVELLLVRGNGRLQVVAGLVRTLREVLEIGLRSCILPQVLQVPGRRLTQLIDLFFQADLRIGQRWLHNEIILAEGLEVRDPLGREDVALFVSRNKVAGVHELCINELHACFKFGAGHGIARKFGHVALEGIEAMVQRLLHCQLGASELRKCLKPALPRGLDILELGVHFLSLLEEARELFLLHLLVGCGHGGLQVLGHETCDHVTDHELLFLDKQTVKQRFEDADHVPHCGIHHIAEEHVVNAQCC
mmetsp:Transcript_10120/g.21394  ORF Transcript_10120/g.21394 Transcript_10120/m.21394 type:complete len:342 (-) Transcript_10120:1120-2145(-)